MNFFVISVKENFFTLLIFIFTLCLIIFSSTNFVAAQNGLTLWATTVLPSLFPFLIATELLCKTNFVHILGKFLDKFMRPIFNVPGESSIAIILGTLSGYPIGAKIVCNLKKQKLISNVEAERLIAYTNNSGPLFILGSIGIGLFGNKKIGLILLISHILSSLIVGLIFRFWKKNSPKFDYSILKNQTENRIIKLSTIGELLSEAIKNAISSVLTIGGFVVLFSVIISILESSNILIIMSNLMTLFKIPKDFTLTLISGILELTNGVNLSSKLFQVMPNISILLTSFLLGLGGISIMFQIYSIISKEGISIKPYIYGKFLQSIVSTILVFIFI